MSETLLEGGQSNVFRVKDVTAFKSWCKNHKIRCLDVDNTLESRRNELAEVTPDMVCLQADESWENLKYECEMDDWNDFTGRVVLAGIAKFLVPGSVAILTQAFVAARQGTIGVGGAIYAVDHKGQRMSASMDELAVSLAYDHLSSFADGPGGIPLTRPPFWPGTTTRLYRPLVPRVSGPGA